MDALRLLYWTQRRHVVKERLERALQRCVMRHPASYRVMKRT